MFSYKSLESFADWNSEFWREGTPIVPQVTRSLIDEASERSETVASILERLVNDVVNGERRIVAASKFRTPKPADVIDVEDFFENPNPENTADEWLEGFAHDLLLHNDAYIEKSGSKDIKSGETRDGSRKVIYAGDLTGIWHIPAALMYLIPERITGQLPTDPSIMAFEQHSGHLKVRFNREKIIRVSRMNYGRLYPLSTIHSLFNIIAGQLNLTDYVGSLYAGDIPKTMINLGKMKWEDFIRLQEDIKKQMKEASNPYGLLTVNVPEGFQLHKLMETSQQGQFLETLKYYREEICAGFGVPPTKMGWATPGQLGGADNSDDAYYDIIELLQRKISRSLYKAVIKDGLHKPDCYLKFASPRPKKIKLQSEARARNARAVQVGRMEGILTPNECRELFEFDRLPDSWADDPRYPSPVVSAKLGELIYNDEYADDFDGWKDDDDLLDDEEKTSTTEESE